MRARWCRVPLLWLALLALPWPLAAQPQEEDTQASEESGAESEEAVEYHWTLEEILGDKGFFGPSATEMDFSFDGSYAAYRYRPYDERRHGSDLWLLDVASGETKRITSVSVLAPFQRSTREVREDRIKKARRAGDEGETEENRELIKALKKSGDWVGEKDADDEKAPRYSGITYYEWSPKANEFIFSSQGDLYRYEVESGAVSRLTKTGDTEQSAHYLPEGDGFLYQRGDSVMHVEFGSHLITELRPSLEGGERMDSYRLSPDGRKLTFVTSRTEGRQSGRTVTIVDFSERFARSYEVGRQVSDDPSGKTTWSVYLWDISDLNAEAHKPIKVYSHEVTGPRDSHTMPDWSPDSTRVVWSVYEQSTDNVWIYEAAFPDGYDHGKTEEPSDEEESKAASNDLPKDEDPEIEAKQLTRFLHNGGPNAPYDIRPWYLADSKRIVLMTEQSGFRHLYILDPLYEAFTPLTQGPWEAYPIELNEEHTKLFLEGTREGPAYRDVYAIDLESAEMTRLTTEPGYYSQARVSPDGRHVLAIYEHYGVLRELVHIDGEVGTQVALTDSHPPKAHALTEPIPQFFSYKNRHGHDIHGILWLPEDLKPEDKRPLLVYVYGGPLGSGSKTVVDGVYGSDTYYFHYYMAKHYGYVTCAIDPRGQSGYGAVFEKASFEQVGVPQTEDLVDGVKFLRSEYGGIDEKRVGIHGWSFGGFQTQMCMYTAPETFAVGIAGAGPTEWENYNAWYAQGVVGDTRVGQADLAEFSLAPRAKELQGRLLLIHGMKDDNVLYQDTVKVYAALLDAGKGPLVDLFLDPAGGHGLGGHVQRLQRYQVYEDFLLRTLGTSAGAPVVPGLEEMRPDPDKDKKTEDEGAEAEGAEAEVEGAEEGENEEVQPAVPHSVR